MLTEVKKRVQKTIGLNKRRGGLNRGIGERMRSNKGRSRTRHLEEGRVLERGRNGGVSKQSTIVAGATRSIAT